MLTLRFDVHDVGDGVYDSGVVVDNMRWSEEEVEDPSSGAPTELHWLSPKVGPTSGGTEVILSGRNFAGGMTVSVGGVVLDASAVTILDSETAEPITTETLRYGQRVTVMGVAVPPIMRSPEALAIFGPVGFGLDEPFTPIEKME